jgi:glucose/arabinose dehydrogenase
MGGGDSAVGTDSGGGGGLCDGITPVPGTPALTVEGVVTLSLPTVVTSAPGDVTRLYVVEQPGRIQIVTLPGDTLLGTPFLDITTTVQNSGFAGDEEGMLGLAFHPDYATNGRFFVYYTENGGVNNVVAEYARSAGDPNVADAASGNVILSIPSEQSNHNGGVLAFGPDGLLYIGSGDGGNQGDPDNDSRDLNGLLGKILRLDVDNPPTYIPASNPFAGGGGAAEIYAYGFRNPWRLSFDRANGDLYIGDVGQDNWEEVSVVSAPDYGIGGDFGWNNCEGFTPFSGSCAGSIAPMVAMSHGAPDNACAVIGGYVYRGCLMPGWQGTYFYSDNCAGWVRTFVYAGGAATMENEDPNLSGNVGGPSSFGEDARGELYITDVYGGTVYRIVPQ